MSTDPFAKITELQGQLDAVREQLNEEQSRNRRLQGLQSEVEELRKSQRASDRALREAREERDEAKREASRVITDSGDLNRRHEALIQQVRTLENDVQSARDFAGRAGDEKREAEALAQRLQVELDKAHKRIGEALDILAS